MREFKNFTLKTVPKFVTDLQNSFPLSIKCKKTLNFCSFVPFLDVFAQSYFCVNRLICSGRNSQWFPHDRLSEMGLRYTSSYLINVSTRMAALLHVISARSCHQLTHDFRK